MMKAVCGAGSELQASEVAVVVPGVVVLAACKTEGRRTSPPWVEIWEAYQYDWIVCNPHENEYDMIVRMREVN